MVKNLASMSQEEMYAVEVNAVNIDLAGHKTAIRAARKGVEGSAVNGGLVHEPASEAQLKPETKFEDHMSRLHWSLCNTCMEKTLNDTDRAREQCF